jgi:hypothetical protein
MASYILRLNCICQHTFEDNLAQDLVILRRKLKYDTHPIQCQSAINNDYLYVLNIHTKSQILITIFWSPSTERPVYKVNVLTIHQG